MKRILLFALLLAGLFNGSLVFGQEADQEAAKAALPQVDAQIDPSKSFWLDHVHYPYPAHFAKVADDHGRQWELAYLDVFRGTPETKAKAPVLVLVHGRAMNSGYWGELMEKPLAAGFRVISIDWAHSGKSLPKNLDLPVARSLDDVRQTIYNLVVKHLDIAKASMLGHSLGGQVVAGYALRYPQHVERLVLYAPGGLGLQAPIEMSGVRLDDPTLLKQPEKFLSIWKTGVLPSFGATQEAVEQSFYVPAAPGKMPYLQRGDNKLNEFMVASRSGILRGNPRELERFAQGYAWDSLAAISECRVEDGQALPNRLPKLKVPTLVALGMKDSVVSAEPAIPLYSEGRRNQAPIVIKLYDNAGHFIHTDLPEQFSNDVLAFLQTGNAPEPLFTGEFAKRTALTELPPDVRKFKERNEAAWVKNDLNAIRALYHPECKSDGQNLDQIIGQISSYYSMLSSWKLDIYSIKPTTDGLLAMDIEAKTNFGNYPMTVILKNVDGEWYYYGNQK